MTAAPIRVVLAAYNRPQYLGAAIDSILAQTQQNFQLVIVNDGSTNPATDAVLQQYNGADPRIAILRQENAGLAAARNAGFEHAPDSPFQYIAFADDDDIALPNRLQEQLAFLQNHPRYAAVTCRHTPINHHGDILPAKRKSKSGHTEAIAEGPALFIRRDAFIAAGKFRPWFRLGEDSEFALRFADSGFKTAKLRRHLILYRRHADKSNQSGHSRCWLYHCAAQYSQYCRQHDMQDGIANGVPLDHILQRIADVIAHPSTAAAHTLRHKLLAHGLRYGRHYVRSADAPELQLLLTGMRRYLNPSKDELAQLRWRALLRGKFGMARIIANA